MNDSSHHSIAIDSYDRYYLSYSGARLPLNLVSPIEPSAIENRNTWFGACVDSEDRITLIHKRVYGDVELSHRYGYADTGHLQWAEIIGLDDEGRKLWFDDTGAIIKEEDLEL